jgi:DNA-binding transcriptional LysR family regulator
MTDKLPSRIEFLRLRDLSLLERIDALRSLRQVAESLHVTQPAVTQALQSLEQAFGAALVVRSSQGVRLTEAGLAAMKRMRVARRELLAARDAAQSPALRELRLGMLPAVTLDLLPRWLSGLRQSFPSAQLILTEATGPLLWSRLEEGALDAIIARPPSPELGELRRSGLGYRLVGHSAMAVVGPRDHPLAGRAPTPHALAAAAWALPPPTSQVTAMLCDWFAAQGVQAPRPVVVSDSFHTNLVLAAESGLLTLAPMAALPRYSKTLGLTALLNPWPSQSRSIVVAYRESNADDPLIQALLDSAPLLDAEAPAPAAPARKRAAARSAGKA